MINLNFQLSVRGFRFFLYLSPKLKNETYEETIIIYLIIKQLFMVCL